MWRWQGCSYKNNFKKHFLVHLHKFLIPLVDVGSFLAGIRVVIVGSWCITSVMGTPFDHLPEDDLVDLTRLSIDNNMKKCSWDRLTLGIGIGWFSASSPRSSIIFLINIERSPISRSVKTRVRNGLLIMSMEKPYHTYQPESQRCLSWQG